MRATLAMMLGAIIALTVPAVPSWAAPAWTGPVLSDLPIPRVYSASGLRRANPSKPADIRANEEANADASEADCSARAWAACTFLGRAYERGEGRPQSRPVAELLYRKACDAGDGAGCHRLGALLNTEIDGNGPQIAAVFYARACRLGALDGCDAEADMLARGNPKAAEALRRATCARGGSNSCRTLAELLLAHGRSLPEQDEGRALLDRQCRAGDGTFCDDAAEHWRTLIMPDSSMRVAEYERLGCDAGNAFRCRNAGMAELATGRGADERAAALAVFDRACAMEEFLCADAAQLREEPGLSTRCEGGDGAACVTLGQSLALRNSPLEDRPRALALLGTACEAGLSEACGTAAILVLERSRDTGDGEPARLEYYLDRSCTAGQRDACEQLADALASGKSLPQDIARAAVLYEDQCDNGRRTACSFLLERAAIDPDTPLMLARANFAPELTPEEVAEEARLKREEDERELAEWRAQICTTTTVVFEGQTYTDTICDPIARMVGGGFIVERGKAPWQALLFRPPTRDGERLDLGARVHCGGSVIQVGWVLTAAHCLNDKHMGGVSIRTGGHRVRLGLVNALGDEGFSYPIIQTFSHPDYSTSNLAFDIALVQYNPKAGRRGSSALPPARIRLDPLPFNQRVLERITRLSTYGWGTTAVENGQIPNELRGGRLKLRDTATCTRITGFADQKRRDHVLCADRLKSADGGQACYGDSGGPLITYSDPDEVPTLIGVVSGGVECGTEGLPSRFIRLAHPRVRAWLDRVLPLSRRR